jgi:dTDP-L-rhamnose 4-epimerase
MKDYQKRWFCGTAASAFENAESPFFGNPQRAAELYLHIYLLLLPRSMVLARVSAYPQAETSIGRVRRERVNKEVLITGGAGFIGSHLADVLLAKGYRVRVLDALVEQVHGNETRRPSYLHPDVMLLRGDVCDPKAVAAACRGVDIVVHLAARVGVGQSMYEINRYTETNDQGTATLLEELSRNPVERLVVASSMSIYGEGLYQRHDGALVPGHDRSLADLKQGRWELYDSEGHILEPVPTPETKTPALASVYALNKYVQERMCLIVGRAYEIPTVALRFFNVYGSRQALSNPYTGVLAIFASRLLNNRSPLIYEDGRQQRDFVHVRDVAQACLLAIETPGVGDQVFNVGGGQPYTVCEIAERMAQVLGKEQIRAELTGKYRMGDIRHCFADISKAQQLLGYQPQVSLAQGMVELAQWLEGQIAIDEAENAHRELAARGLAV